MKPIRNVLLIGLAGLLLVVAGCGSPSVLDEVENGVILYHTGDATGQRLQEALQQLADTYDFDFVSLDIAKDRKQLERYEKDHRKLIDNYNKVRELEARLSELKPGIAAEERDAVRNSIQLDYKKALVYVKNKTLTEEDRAQLDKLVKQMAERQSLTEDEIRHLLELQTEARLPIPKYSERDGDGNADNLPLIKVVYDDNIRKTISFRNNPIPEETLADIGQLQEFLKQDAWISNFSSDSSVEPIKQLFENKETFILLNYGNSCPHCHKLMPVLDVISGELNIPYYKIDTFIAKNAIGFNEMIRSGKYNLPEMKWVPTLLFVKDGQAASILDAYEYAIANAEAELGYDIDTDVIADFFRQVETAKQE